MRKVKTFKIYQFFMIKENAQVLGDEFLQHYILRTWKVWSLSFWMLYLKFSWDNFSWFYRFKRTHIKKVIHIWFGTDNSIFQMCLVDQIRKYGDSSFCIGRMKNPRSFLISNRGQRTRFHFEFLDLEAGRRKSLRISPRSESY